MSKRVSGAAQEGTGHPGGAGTPAGKPDSLQGKLDAVRENIAKAFVGPGETVDLLLTALICQGHVLIEDMPGLGKTTLASALARSLGCTFGRIQFTPDVTPADVTGYSLINLATGEREVHMGSVMRQIILADEINRAGPKTQSSLLEAMQERQVTIDGETYPLPAPFMVLATQNPLGLAGTFPLPEAQLDRFLLRLSIGYPDRAGEGEILRRGMEGGSAELSPVLTREGLEEIHKAFRGVACAQAVVDYIIDIAAATRVHEQIELGISPRGSLALLNASRAYALLQGRDYVRPDDVQKLAGPVLLHRIRLKSQAVFRQQTAERVLSDIVRGIRVPGVG